MKKQRVVAYIRTATDAPSGNNTSDAQLARIKEFCERKGFEVVGVFEDIGVSGLDVNRPGLTRAVESMKAEHADGLVIVSLDRISRDLRWLDLFVREHFSSGYTLFHAVPRFEISEGAQ